MPSRKSPRRSPRTAGCAELALWPTVAGPISGPYLKKKALGPRFRGDDEFVIRGFVVGPANFFFRRPRESGDPVPFPPPKASDPLRPHYMNELITQAENRLLRPGGISVADLERVFSRATGPSIDAADHPADLSPMNTSVLRILTLSLTTIPGTKESSHS